MSAYPQQFATAAPANFWYDNTLSATTAGTATVTTSGGDDVLGFLLEFSGLSSTATVDSANSGVLGPFANNTTFSGVPMSCPVGGQVVAICIDVTSNGSNRVTAVGATATINSSAPGTYGCVTARWAGTGGVITPQFNNGTLLSSSNFYILQFLMFPPGVIRQCAARFATSGGYHAAAHAHIDCADQCRRRDLRELRRDLQSREHVATDFWKR